jgi:predicted dehydrogenase
MVTVLCRLANGMEGVMEFSGIAPFAGPDRLEVYGNEGMLAYDFSRDEIHGGRFGEGPARRIPIPPELEQSWSVEENFIAAVRAPGSIIPQPSFGEGLQYMKVVQAVSDSIQGGREVEIR